MVKTFIGWTSLTTRNAQILLAKAICGFCADRYCICELHSATSKTSLCILMCLLCHNNQAQRECWNSSNDRVFLEPKAHTVARIKWRLCLCCQFSNELPFSERQTLMSRLCFHAWLKRVWTIQSTVAN